MATFKPAGGPAVHSLDHFCLTVPNLDEARTFYTEFGLDVRDVAGGLELYTFGNPHRWAVIRPGARKKLEYVAFGAFEQDIEQFRQKFADLGIEMVEPLVCGEVCATGEEERGGERAHVPERLLDPHGGRGPLNPARRAL